MKRILVVDDDQTTRHVLRKVLTSAGFSATVAKDGVDGLKALKSKRFDLLLLDVWMPRMNGLEMLGKLRATKARPRVVARVNDAKLAETQGFEPWIQVLARMLP